MNLADVHPEIFDLAKKLYEKCPNQLLEFYGPQIGVQSDQIVVWDNNRKLQAVINMATRKYDLYIGSHSCLASMLEHFVR